MELTNKNVRIFYEYAAYLICFGIIRGYVPYFAIIKNKKTSMSNIAWILAIAVNDLCIAVNLAISGWLLMGKTGKATEFGCHVYAFVTLGFGFVSLACIFFNALDRYCRQFLSSSAALSSPTTVAGVCAASFAIGGLPLVGIGQYESITDGTVICLIDAKAEANGMLIYVLAAIFFALPLSMVNGAYGKLARESKEYKRMELLVRTVLACYLPYVFYAVGASHGLNFPDWTVALCHLCPKTLSIFNPVIYLNDPEIQKLLYLKEEEATTDRKSAKSD